MGFASTGGASPDGITLDLNEQGAMEIKDGGVSLAKLADSARKGLYLVEERVITTASQTEDFTGLDGDADGLYIIEGRLVNGTGSSSNYSIRANGAAVAGSRQILSVEGSSVSGGADTSLTIVGAAAGNTADFEALMSSSVSGATRHLICRAANEGGTFGILLVNMKLTTPSSGTNITSVGVAASVADGVGVGSIIRLWKRQA